jgi:bifunctional ADP-heptose synthase (sugar kinase/adenylyltransferase)
MIFGQVLSLEEVPALREQLRREGRTVVATNGCFDLLHVGHLRYLTEARARGRPLVPEADRAELLAAWRVVDAVTLFPEVRATTFLQAVQPDIYVKGGDYTPESLNGEETAALHACGARIEIVPLIPGRSTSRLVEKMAS